MSLKLFRIYSIFIPLVRRIVNTFELHDEFWGNNKVRPNYFILNILVLHTGQTIVRNSSKITRRTLTTLLVNGKTISDSEAKEILGDIVCIKGNVPNSLLVAGIPQEVRDYCKKLIDVVGKDGGLIVDAGAVIDGAKPENVKAMTDFTKEYGVYR